jgi:XTP/dITP diphosphohydrolase
MKILLATKNKGKLEELQQMLKSNRVNFISVEFDDVDETGKTYEENAILKAETTCAQTGLPTIADDSGMELEALGGFPGIYSARCAGEVATNKEKQQYILEKMNNEENRNVKFVCCIAFARPNRETICVRGECYGTLLKNTRGISKQDVQYDSLFEHNGKTFAEISEEDKNKISHRAVACNKIKPYLRDLKRFSVSIVSDVVLTEEELWPNNDGPLNPTVNDVETLIENCGNSKVIDDWYLPVDIYIGVK